MTNKEWFREARFGMMVHWGLYSMLGGEYKDSRMGWGERSNQTDLGEWIQTYFRIPNAEYEQLAKAFDPVGFDAEEWVKLAKDAGMNYIVVTSKHHEGFAMFKSEADPYNIADATPFGRDPIDELAKACRKYGLKLGLYYSQELDWHEPDGGGYNRGYKNEYSSWTNNWDFPDNEKKDFARCFEKKIKPQVKEILTKYGDLCLIWFDTPGVITPEQSQELYDLVKKYQPDCLVNSRIGNGKGDYESMGDNQIPGAKKNAGMLFETAATLNDTWGYKSFDQNWKSSREVISLLTRLASRNVNYLLNVGPDHIGRIPVPAQHIFRETGKWLRVNGEAVYGCGPSPYNVELPTGPVTQKGDSIYCVLNDPKTEVRIPGVLSEVQSAELLGFGKLDFTQKDGTVTVTLPELTEPLYPVVKLTSAGGVCVDTGVFEMPDQTLSLSPINAQIQGDICISRACDMQDWKDEGSLLWKMRVQNAGTYRVSMTVNGMHEIEPVQADVALTVNGNTYHARAAHDRDVDPLIMRHHKGMISELGNMELTEGENTVSLCLDKPVDRDMFRFAQLRFERVK